MKQTERVSLECVGEIRQDCKAVSVLGKNCRQCVEGSRGGHYFLLGRMRKGWMEQVTIELDLEHVQMRGTTSRTKQKVGKCIVLQKLTSTCSVFHLLKILFCPVP